MRIGLKIKEKSMSWTSNIDVSISGILVNAVSFLVIVTLRDDPLSTGMLDVFF